jgi:hypothetical protein
MRAPRLDGAINALEGSSPRRGRPPQICKTHSLNVANRTETHRCRDEDCWAKRKRASIPKKAKAPAKKGPARQPMSPAARKRLAALMKARWAEKKKAGGYVFIEALTAINFASLALGRKA